MTANLFERQRENLQKAMIMTYMIGQLKTMLEEGTSIEDILASFEEERGRIIQEASEQNKVLAEMCGANLTPE